MQSCRLSTSGQNLSADPVDRPVLADRPGKGFVQRFIDPDGACSDQSTIFEQETENDPPLLDALDGIVFTGMVARPREAVKNPAFDALGFNRVRDKGCPGQKCRCIGAGILALRLCLMPKAGHESVS